MTGKHWIIALIILIAGYSCYTGLRDLLQRKDEKENWTELDKSILVKNCIRDAKDMATKYPELTKNYCECSNEKIFARFAKSKYLDIIQQSLKEQKKVLLPVFQDCLNEYQSKIKEVENK